MLNKNTLAASAGTLLEWAEFSFYAYLITQFSRVFFPAITPRFAIFMGLSTFAISYIARPIGSILWGYIGDRAGRKQALVSSMLVMGLATLAIGLLPTYNVIGIAAPIMLIILRFLQGLAMAGEYTGAAVFLAEHDGNRSYLASSWVATFSALGILIGALAAVIISLPTMPAWAWRLPFLLGAIGCGFGFYARRHLLETKLYQERGKTAHNPLSLLIQHYKTPLLKTAALAAFVGVYIYTCNIWWISFAIQHNYVTNFQAHAITAMGQAGVVVLIPLMAMLAEFIGGQRLMAVGFIGAALTAFVLFSVSNSGDLYLIGMTHVVYAVFNACVAAPMFKYLAEIFPTEVRYSGQAVGWSFAVAIFGGTAPLIAQALSDYLPMHWAPALYVILSALIALRANCFKLNPDKPSNVKHWVTTS